MILTGVLSAAFFGTSIDLHFMLAVVNVVCSIALYGNLGNPQPGSAGVAPKLPSPVAKTLDGHAEALIVPPCSDSAKHSA